MAGRGLRSFTYQAVGQLAARTPQLLAKDVTIAARFFQVRKTAGFKFCRIAGPAAWHLVLLLGWLHQHLRWQLRHIFLSPCALQQHTF